MGNRAVITTPAKKIGVYLHWNGGRDTVEPLLAYMRMRGFRSPDIDSYGWARLCQVMGNFFGGELSIGVDNYEKLDKDNGDNGVYIVENWKIVGREYFTGPEQSHYDFEKMLYSIDEMQPKDDQLGRDKIKELLKGGE